MITVKANTKLGTSTPIRFDRQGLNGSADKTDFISWKLNLVSS